MRQVPPAHTPVPPAALLALAAPRGDAVTRLEAALSETWGRGPTEFLGSGTQALQRSLMLLAGRTGAVAMPGWGCFDLASAAVGAGIEVRLYDLEPETLQPDPDSLASVAAEVDGMVVASFFGITVDPTRLPAGVGAGGDGPILIHDAAQAYGTRFPDRSIEERADATVLSFGRGKGWTGLSGGALILRSERMRVRAEERPATLVPPRRGLAGAFARGAAQWALGRPSLYGVPARIPALGLGETHYHPPRPLEALDPGAAAVLLASRDAAEKEAAHRRAEGARLRALIADLGDGAVLPIDVTGEGAPGYLRLPVLDGGGADRGRGRAVGVMPSYPRPLRRLEPLKGLLRVADPTPGSDALAERLLTLPTHSRSSASDRRRLEAWLTRPSSPRAP